MYAGATGWLPLFVAGRRRFAPSVRQGREPMIKKKICTEDAGAVSSVYEGTTRRFTDTDNEGGHPYISAGMHNTAGLLY
jgi:hypothetical protein